MAGKRGQKRRFWSDDEKREICRQASLEGVSVAQVAGRCSANANLIHKWLRDPRFSSDTGDEGCTEQETIFLPIEVEADVAVEPAAIDEVPMRSPSAPVSASRVDITLSEGRRILIEGPTSLLAIVGLVQGLTS